MKEKNKNIWLLAASIVLICAVTYCAGFVQYINIYALRITVLVGMNLLNGLIALLSIRFMGLKFSIDFKEKKQYIIGIWIALALSFVIVFIPALFNISLSGEHQDFSWFILIYDFLFYLFIIGPVEELVFRVYLQDYFVSLFKKNKWLGVVIASLLFGLWHIINGNFIQVLFAFGIGLVFGFAKFKIKNCSYVSVAFGHGLYDFLITIARMFVIH